MLNNRYIKSIYRDTFVLISFPVFLFQFLFCYILERKDKKWFIRNPGRDISFPIFTRKEIETKRIRKEIITIISRLNHFLSFLSNIQQKRN